MAGFFKSIFKSPAPKPAPALQRPLAELCYEHFQTLTYRDLVAVMGELDGNQPVSLCVDIARRCYEIALLDEEVSDQDRAAAWKLGEVADNTARKALSGKPGVIAQLEEAKRGLIDQGRKFGHGSLMRKQKLEAPDADIFRYAMLPENRSLAGAYLEAAFSGGRKDNVRAIFVRELVRQDNYGGSNAVIILHALAAKRDPAVLELFSHDEFVMLLKVPEDYQSARSLLVDLAILPSISGARHFKELPSVAGVAAAVLKEKFEDADNALASSEFSDHEKELLGVTARFLYIDLVDSLLAQIFGASKASDDFKTMISKPDMIPFREAFSATRQKVSANELGAVSLDTGLLLAAMTADGSFPQTEEEFEGKKRFITSGTEWINNLRVPFLEYLRFILRALANPMQDSGTSEDKELLKILAAYYRENGARSAIAESAMNFEDWVGYGDPN